MARPVALTRFSPLAVRGISVEPVWRPSRDHSVSPWRTMKTRGVDICDFCYSMFFNLKYKHYIVAVKLYLVLRDLAQVGQELGDHRQLARKRSEWTRQCWDRVVGLTPGGKARPCG